MDSEQNFGEELLHKIEEKKIKPRPRWEFLVKNILAWILGALSLILGAISMSLIFYMIRYNDLGVYRRIGGYSWEKILIIVPAFWLICLALFIFIVLYDIRHTKKGYRYSWASILGAAIIASIILGGIFYACGVHKVIDDMLGRHLPFYDRIINPHIEFWSQPGGGRLTGLIIQQAGPDEYRLIDRDSVEWRVLINSARQDEGAKLEIERPARFLGEIRTDHEFDATEILPILPPGFGFFERFNTSSQNFNFIPSGPPPQGD